MYKTQNDPVITAALVNGRVTVAVSDHELRDFIEDYLTENFDGMEVEWLVEQTLYLVESANLDQVKHALSLLPEVEVQRIWLLNNK